MVHDIRIDDKAVVEETLKRMQSKQPTIPADKVRLFMNKIGEEIQRSGELRREVLDDLLKRLQDGVL